MSRRRLSIRLRLTAAVAAAATLGRAGARRLRDQRQRAHKDDTNPAPRPARWTAAARMYTGSGTVSGFPLEDADESFVQVVDRSGAVRDHAGVVYASPLFADELDRAVRARVRVHRAVPGIEKLIPRTR